jgi:hypothetical protein
MSQSLPASQSPIDPSTLFAQVRFEQVLKDLDPLRDSIARVNNKESAQAWAGAFGNVMVCLVVFLFLPLVFTWRRSTSLNLRLKLVSMRRRTRS